MKNLRLFFLTRFALNAFISEDYRKALRYFEKIRQISPDYPGISYNMGLCCLGMQEYESAEARLLEDLEEFGESPDRLRILGDLYYRWGRQNRALESYIRLSEITGNDDEEGWLMKRIDLLRSDESAEKALAAAAGLDTALIAMKEKDYGKARHLLEEAAEADPSSFQILNNLGVVAMRADRDPERALIYFRKAESLMPLPVHKENIRKAEKALKSI